VKIFFYASLFLLIGPVTQACEWRESSYESNILPRGPRSAWRVNVLTLLPNGYDPTLAYGVVYFLHGLTGDRNVLRDVDACRALDAHVARGGTPFVMVAMDGGNYYWMHGASNGIRMGDALARGWCGLTELRLRTIPSPAGRVIAGISMGGHGAIQLSMNYPGVFGAVGAHSPVFRTEPETYLDFPGEFGRGHDFANRDPVSLIARNPRALPVPLFFDIGGRDPFVANTIRFGRTLERLVPQPSVFALGTDGIGGHEGGYWHYHFPEYVAWYGSRLPRPRR